MSMLVMLKFVFKSKLWYFCCIDYFFLIRFMKGDLVNWVGIEDLKWNILISFFFYENCKIMVFMIY